MTPVWDGPSLETLIARIERAPRPPGVQLIVVAVDGCGGAGKSTFAARLADALGGAPVVSTDEFASWDNPLDWYPRVVDELLTPLAAGKSATYRRSDWGGGESIIVTVEPTPMLVLEGVSSSRHAFDDYLAFRIWIETDRDERLRRGLERDGAHMRDQWLQWIADEDTYVARENPRVRADIVIRGDA